MLKKKLGSKNLTRIIKTKRLKIDAGEPVISSFIIPRILLPLQNLFFYTVSVYVKNKAGFSGLPISWISGPSPISAALRFFAVLWIRIPMDSELLPGSGSGIIVPDPAESVRASK